MVEQQRKRVEDAITKIVEEVDKEYLRKMQGDMHKCAARCCEDTTSSMVDVHRCVERCSNGLTGVQDYVQNEFNGIQTRLQRCVMDCNDDVKDKISSSNSETDVSKYNDIFEKCCIKCVDKHVELLPTMLKRMKEVLRQKQETLHY